MTEEIIKIYSFSYPKEQIENALNILIEKEFVIYLRQSNSYLKLKETSGVDIPKAIHDEIERNKKTFVLSKVLNETNTERYFYPYRYNDEKEMSRYFDFEFVDFSDILNSPTMTNSLLTHQFSDGKIIAVICNSKNKIEEVKNVCRIISSQNKKATHEWICF